MLVDEFLPHGRGVSRNVRGKADWGFTCTRARSPSPAATQMFFGGAVGMAIDRCDSEEEWAGFKLVQGEIYPKDKKTRHARNGPKLDKHCTL